MESTTNLALPYIMPSQAQKHVTHNEALQILDALVQLSLKSRGFSTPPDEPSEGDRYLVGPDAEDGWHGRSGSIALFADGGWNFATPRSGFLAWIEDEEKLTVHLDGTFVDVVPAVEAVAMLGINAAADPTNRLAVAAPATLLTHEGGSHRLSVNKETPSDTASLVFSTGFSARAEIGLAGGNLARMPGLIREASDMQRIAKDAGRGSSGGGGGGGGQGGGSSGGGGAGGERGGPSGGQGA